VQGNRAVEVLGSATDAPQGLGYSCCHRFKPWTHVDTAAKAIWELTLQIEAHRSGFVSSRANKNKSPCAAGYAAGPARQDGVAPLGEDRAARQVAHQSPVDGCAGKVEVGHLLGERQPGITDLVADRARLFLRDLRGQQITNDLLCRVLPLQTVRQHFVKCR
jgi:hypothetical protein